MRIGIFGCTADPFTKAHAAIVSKLLCDHIVDRVIVAPTIVDYHREGKLPWLSNDQKCELINLMLSNNPDIMKLPSLKAGYWEIWDKEFKIQKLCKTYSSLKDKYVNGHRFIDTLVEIIESQEWNFVGDKIDNEYFVVMGSDSFWNFKTWFMWEDIAKLAKIIVAKGRDGIDLPGPDLKYPECITIDIDSKLAGVSATKIRAEWRNRGFDAYKEHIIASFNAITEDEHLLHTPIFDIVKGAETQTGLKPIKINAPDWVTIIVEKGGKLLVEKQFRYGSDCEVEEFPCGMVEKSESASDAAARELEEETGYKVSAQALMYLGSVNPNPAFMTNMMHYFYVDLDHADYEIVSQMLDDHEKITFSWKDKDNFIAETMEKISSGIQVPAMLLSAFKMYDKNLKHIMCETTNN